MPSSESVQSVPPVSAASMAFASGGVSVTNICGRTAAKVNCVPASALGS